MSRSKNKIVSTVLCMLVSSCLSSACTEPVEPDDDWDVKQDYKPLHLGFYEMEVEILEDGCEPSLSSIISASPEWPPKRTYVTGSPSYAGENGHIQADLDIYGVHLRTGDVLLNTAYLSDDWRPFGKLDTFVSPYDFDLACQGEMHLDRDFEQEVEFVPNRDGSFRMVYTTEWQRSDACTTSMPGDQEEYVNGLQENWTWRPAGACKESFAIDFTLTHAYPRPGMGCGPVGSLGYASLEDGTNTYGFPELDERDLERCEVEPEDF